MELHPEYVALIVATLVALAGAFIGYVWRAAIWKTKVEERIKALQGRDPELKELIEGVRLRVEESDRVQSEQHRNLAERLTRELAALKESEAEARRPLHQEISSMRADLANLRGYLAARDEGQRAPETAAA